MLVALAADGRLVTLRSHEQARALAGQAFYCPACRGPLRIKNGPQLIAHFAHLDHACAASSEPESETHLAGKWYLAHYGEALGFTVTLEQYYPAIQQRADVVWEEGGRSRVLEFQCSGISPARLLARTQGYQSLGLEVIWIAGPQYHASWPGGKQARFLRWSEAAGFHLWQLDPARSQLARLELTAAAVVATVYQGRQPQVTRRAYAEPLTTRAKAVQQALVHRDAKVLSLQALAGRQGLNLGGVPWAVHQQLRHLPGLDTAEWLIRSAWLLQFQGGPIEKAAEAAFWRSYSSVKAPQLAPGQLQAAVRQQWLQLLTAGGYLAPTPQGWHWLRQPRWYRTVDEKLQALGQAGLR